MRPTPDSRPGGSRRHFLKLALGGGGWLAGTRGSSFAQELPGERNPAPNLTGRILLVADSSPNDALNGLFLFDLRSGKWQRIHAAEEGDRFFATAFPTLSPDGRTVAYIKQPRPNGFEGIWTVPTAGGTEPRKICEIDGWVSWSHDSRKLIVSGRARMRSLQLGERHPTWIMNADGSGRTRLPVPEENVVLDWSPDGKWLLTGYAYALTQDTVIEILHLDGTEKHRLADGRVVAGTCSFAPDSRSIVYVRSGDRLLDADLWRVDLDGQNHRRLYRKAEGTTVSGALFSPDGKWVAVTIVNVRERGLPRWIEILDKDGKPRRRIDLPFASYTLFDWR